MDYLSPAQAQEYLKVSRFIFDERIRPELTEIRHGPRTVRFARVELDQYLADSGGMWNKKKVRDALDRAWELKWKNSKGSRKKDSLRNLVAKEIGHEPCIKWDYERMERWVLDMKQRDLAAATIRARVSCLMYALKLAAQKGWIKAPPEIPEIEPSNKRLRFLRDEPDEEAKLIAACGCLHYEICDVMRPAIVFLLDTGCRLSELVKVRNEHVLKGGVLFEDRKAADNLLVPLTPAAREAIETLLKNKYWMRRVRGAEWDKKRCESAVTWFSHQFIKVRNKAGLRDVNVHTLRHTCASRLVQAGVPLLEVGKLLGHSSITVTERYAHLAPNQLDRAAAVLANRRLPDKVKPIRGTSQ